MSVTESDVRKRMKHGGKLHNCTAQTTRFELPLDLKQLEGMQPKDYLRQYSIISTRRMYLYQKVFQKHRNTSGNAVDIKDLEKCVADILVGGISRQKLQELKDLAGLQDTTELDPKLFFAFCAMTERQTAGRKSSEEKDEMTECRKQQLESADFTGLRYKFNGLRLRDELRRLLVAL